MKQELQEVQVACLKMGDGLYAVDIMRIKEIIRLPKLSPLPRSLPFVEGVINLRGSVIPVVSLRKRFGLPPAENEDVLGEIGWPSIAAGAGIAAGENAVPIPRYTGGHVTVSVFGATPHACLPYPPDANGRPGRTVFSCVGGPAGVGYEDLEVYESKVYVSADGAAGNRIDAFETSEDGSLCSSLKQCAVNSAQSPDGHGPGHEHRVADVSRQIVRHHHSAAEHHQRAIE